MTKRMFFSLAASVAALSLGMFDARAVAGSYVPIPAYLDPSFVTSTGQSNGNYTTVNGVTFSSFSDVITANPTTPAPTADTAIKVAPFTSIAGLTGISFNGALTAAAGQTVDYALTYTVTAAPGTKITDAYLSLGGFVNDNGTGSVKTGETILVGSTTIGSLQVSTLTTLADHIYLTTPETTFVVQKDITVFGGSNGATFSFTNQGFSTSAVPEPASLALLGIGLSGLFSIRRFLKRSVA